MIRMHCEIELTLDRIFYSLQVRTLWLALALAACCVCALSDASGTNSLSISAVTQLACSRTVTGSMMSEQGRPAGD